MNSTTEVADRLKTFAGAFMSAQQCSDALMQFSEAYKARLKQAEADEEERARYARLSGLIEEYEAASNIQTLVSGIIKDFCGQLIDAFLSKPRQGHARKAQSRKARRRMQRRLGKGLRRTRHRGQCPHKSCTSAGNAELVATITDANGMVILRVAIFCRALMSLRPLLIRPRSKLRKS